MNFDPQNMPKHVAIIMDGNGRWAKQQGKLRVFGHQNGVKAVRSAVSFAAKHGIKVLTLYAFSSENWSRPEAEVSALMALFMKALDSEVKKLHKNNIRLKIIGDKSGFSETLQNNRNQYRADFKYSRKLRELLGYYSSCSKNGSESETG